MAYALKEVGVMFLEQAQRTLNAYINRYAHRYNSDCTDFYKLSSYADAEKTVIEVSIADYSHIAWLDDNDELHIVNSKTGESILDYAVENGWSEEDVSYIRFGDNIYGKCIHEDGSYTNNSYGKRVVPTPDCMDLPNQ